MHTCKNCGKEERNHYIEPVKVKLEENQLCHDCDFWTDYVKRTNDSDVARITGVHYVMGDETNEPAHFRGFGGDKFKIRFRDGREVVSTNLWCQGDIPERFRDQLSDNAEFVRG